MKSTCATFFLAAVLLALAGRAELLYNPAFTTTEPLSAAMTAQLARHRIVFAGESWPKFWMLQNKAAEAESRVAFSGAWTLTEVRNLLLAGQNYRIPLDRLTESSHCRLTVQATGTGTIEAGFFTYAPDHQFTGNVSLGTLTLNPDVPVHLTRPVPAFPAAASQTSLYLIFTGTCTLKGVSLVPLRETIVPSAETRAAFDALSPAEQQQAVLHSDSLEMLVHAARQGSVAVRNRACYRLGTLGVVAAPAAEVLVENMSDQAEYVRVQAAVALTKIGPSAYADIRRLLLGGDKNNRLTMATAVRGMPRGVPAALQAEVEWANPPVMQTGDSLLPDSSFEGSTSQTLAGWEILFKDGATGHWSIDDSRARSGMQSLKITKTNGLGYVLLRSTCPVIVPAGKETWSLRGFFQCFDASFNTLLLPRLENPSGNLLWDDTGLNGGAGWQSQSLLRNTPQHYWDTRLIMFRQRETEQRLRPAFALYGNPATVWLDDVEFPAPPWKVFAAGPTYPQPRLTLAEAMARISARPRSTVEVKKVDGKSALLINGRRSAPALYLATRGALGDFQVITADGGIELPVVRLDLRSGGNYPPFADIRAADGVNDFSPFFATIEQALCQAPDAHVVLGLNISFPDDYVERHPDQAWINEKGEKGWGTPGHFRGFAEALPEGGSPDYPHIWWPSQYSEQAFAEAGEVVRQFLLQLKDKPYAHVISGVFVSGGHDGQFMIHKRDYSEPCLQQWRAFLHERYGDDQTLAQSWNQPGVTLATAPIVPDQPEKSVDDLFYQPGQHRPFADFKEFEERQIWKNFERYAKIFKEVFGRDKIALSWCMGGGWSKNFAYFFQSEYLDAFVGQPSYQYRQPGSSGGFNVAAESCSYHGKLAVSELDTRNWMRGVYNELVTQRIGTPTSARHFAAVTMKEAGRMIARYQGYWFFDIGQNAYRHPAATAIIKATKEAAAWVCQQAESDRFVPDVAIVFHQQSQYWEIPWGSRRSNFPSVLVDYQIYALRLAGVPFSAYFLDDVMANPDFQKHKVYIFLNAYCLDEAERAFIRGKLQRDGKTLVWSYAPGYLDASGASVEHITALTGMRTATADQPAGHLCVPVAGAPLSENLPANMGVADVFQRRFSLGPDNTWKMKTRRFWIEDEQAVPIARYHDTGQTAVAVKRFPDWTSIYSAQAGGIDAELLHNIARAAGAYTLTRPGLVTDMNGNFISLHAFSGGTYRLRLPRRATVHDVMSGNILATDVEILDLEMTAQNSQWLLLK